MKEGGDLDNVGVHGRITLKWILMAVQWEGMDLIHLVQNRDKCWAVVNICNEPSDTINCWDYLD